jgi:hypothetical protein
MTQDQKNASMKIYVESAVRILTVDSNVWFSSVFSTDLSFYS